MSTYGRTPSTSTNIPMASTSQQVIPFSERPTSLNQQVVLEEDEYTAALSHIIARDFFPSIEGMDATNEYLAALDSGDEQRITSSVRHLTALNDRTPLASSSYAATPLGSTRLQPQSRKRTHAEMYGSLGLDDFQTNFTSEDNASFTSILDDENKKRKERWGWAYEAEQKAKVKALEWKEKRARLITAPSDGEGAEQKLLTDGSDKTRGKEKGTEIITEEGTGNDDEDDEASVLALVLDSDEDKALVPSSSSSAPKPPQEPESGPWDPNNILSRTVDKRSATVPTWTFKTRNAFMFPPDADSSPYHPPPPPAPGVDSSAAAPQKVINHSNTRLLEQEDEKIQEPPSPSRSRISRTIRGDISALSSDGPSEAEGPRGSYPLVDAIPSPSPEMLGPGRLKQLMTWGKLSATPRALPSEGDGQAGVENSPFRIAPPTPRDDLARRLGTTASRSLREKAALYASTPAASVYSTPSTVRSAWAGTPTGRGSMPPPSFIPSAKRGDLLSAAGKSLLSRAGAKSSGVGEELQRTAAKRRAEAMTRTSGWEGVSRPGNAGGGRLGGARWTPSPSPRRSAEE
ncbi:hypothetical protein DACRYDRAFT_101031 [Dacryopinax primogenitus]|uniref:Nuclear protein DGCR14 n=1 Tax=Dacryopinax primogenitus (strain DJM 731) TaxID=1858805 RepID=M5FUI2_DACPD|nr:uncharacterized protein DACRYDRAFT_101031 [Dacryopinax primogenitus]EJT99893.1 hypothetical protein DACRYDRAFT_101031 [Dacryopinax primogenitus]